MKAILIPLFVLLAMAAGAQENNSEDNIIGRNDSIVRYYVTNTNTYGISKSGDTILIFGSEVPPQKIKPIHPPGFHLNRAGNWLISGSVITLTGAILAGAGASSGKKAVAYTSIGLNVGGFVMMLTGYAQIKRSGKRFREHKL